MSVLTEVLKDLAKMFAADARMSFAALALVALAWGVTVALPGDGLVAGLVLALGAAGVLLGAVAAAARAAARKD